MTANGTAVVSLSSQSRNLLNPLCTAGAASNKSDDARERHRDYSPVNTLLTGAAPKCGLAKMLPCNSPAAVEPLLHQPRSASRITTVPLTTPLAIALPSVRCFVALLWGSMSTGKETGIDTGGRPLGSGSCCLELRRGRLRFGRC